MKKCFSAQSIFARMGDYDFFVLSMVFRLDAEHIENMPNVGRLLYYEKSHITANGDILKRNFYLTFA